MQGISVLGLVAEAVATSKSTPAPDLRLFENINPPRHSFAPGLLLSVLFHSLLILGGPPLMDLIPESDAEAMNRHLRAMRALEIRIPERLYLPVPAPEPPKPTAANPKPKESRPPVELARNQLQAPSQASPAAQRRLARQFQLPPQAPRVKDEQTLIQPHLPPDLALEAKVKLPEMVLMSGPVLPRPAPRRFVEPGRSAAPAVVPRVDAPPQLAASAVNPEVRIDSMLAGTSDALLRLPRPTVPTKQFQAPAPLPTGRGASLSPAVGEPISILALSPDPAPLGERVSVPAGNQVGWLPALPAYSESAGSSGRAGAAGGATATSEGLAALVKAIASLPARFSTPIRVEHPVNTAFDVVVIQAGADPSFPESVKSLSGQPVYTVYLKVGAPKAWILQFCLPREGGGAPRVLGGAVNIGVPDPVNAPFPLVSVLPPVTMVPRRSYIILHGTIDPAGQFRDLLVLRAPNAQYKELILPELAKWQFRPAVRNGAPATVEFLLAIPPQTL